MSQDKIEPLRSPTGPANWGALAREFAARKEKKGPRPPKRTLNGVSWGRWVGGSIALPIACRAAWGVLAASTALPGFMGLAQGVLASVVVAGAWRVASAAVDSPKRAKAVAVAQWRSWRAETVLFATGAPSLLCDLHERLAAGASALRVPGAAAWHAGAMKLADRPAWSAKKIRSLMAIHERARDELAVVMGERAVWRRLCARALAGKPVEAAELYLAAPIPPWWTISMPAELEIKKTVAGSADVSPPLTAGLVIGALGLLEGRTGRLSADGAATVERAIEQSAALRESVELARAVAGPKKAKKTIGAENGRRDERARAGSRAEPGVLDETVSRRAAAQKKAWSGAAAISGGADIGPEDRVPAASEGEAGRTAAQAEPARKSMRPRRV
jgi:hypothetical protein